MLSLSVNTLPILIPFLTSLLTQINDPSYKSHLDHQFSPDFLTEGGITFVNGADVPVKSACESGPKGEIPPMDFIIVGAGSSGSVLANRLATAFPTKTVLLIEAGGDGFINLIPPGFLMYNIRDEEITYDYRAEVSSEYGGFMEDGILAYAGKSLGGTSINNGMIMHCASEADYNHWADVTGDPSWNAVNMFKNIREFTNVGDETLRNDPECLKYLGTDGPLHVTSFNDSGIIEEPTLMFKAGAAAGYEILKDVNCGKHLGFVQFRSAIKNGERNSAAAAFLAPMKDNKNLMILKNSFVKKVIMKEGEVVGVLVETKNTECKEFEVHANLEVIISAGTFNSPGILLRSGIGREVDLREINVDQVLDLNVGHNYKEHFNTWHYVAVEPQHQDLESHGHQTVEAHLHKASDSYQINRLNQHQISEPQQQQRTDTYQDLDDFENYLQNRKGPYSHIAPESVFFNLNGDGPEPDVTWDYGTIPLGGFSAGSMKGLGDFKEKYFEVLNNWTLTHDLIMVQNLILQPKSSGRVTTKDDHPVIHANYFSNPDDVRIIIQGIRKLEEFIETPYMKNLNATLVNMKLEECQNFVYDTDDYWKCYLKFYSSNSYHPVGTCKMGKIDDPETVVDSRLKVIGVKGKTQLRVVDASVMPQVPRANTMCPAYAVGWNAAKMIIEDNQDDGGDDNSGERLSLSWVMGVLVGLRILWVFD